MRQPGRTELVLVSGVDRGAVATVGEVLREPGTVIVTHDLTGLREGVVHRTVHEPADRGTAPDGGSAADRASATGPGSAGRRPDPTDWVARTTVLELTHGCVSCTLRDDLLPLIVSLAARDDVHRIVLLLDPGMEPSAVCAALASAEVDGVVGCGLPVDVAGVVTVLDGAAWLDDAGGDDTLAERGRALTSDDDRTLAEVVIGAVELADVLVVVGSPQDAWDRVRRDAVLDRLAPHARRLHLTDIRALTGADLPSRLADLHPESRRGGLDDPHAPLLRGQPPLSRDAGVSLVHVGLRRPFHPERLHEAFDALLTGTLRVRGRVWLASQPDAVLWVESAGGALQIGHVGRWLAADPELWETVDDERRAAAALRWDERWGDREQQLTILVHDADPAAVITALDAALLDDAELAAGEDAWRALPDPFGRWHADPCDELPDAFGAADRGTGQEHS